MDRYIKKDNQKLFELLYRENDTQIVRNKEILEFAIAYKHTGIVKVILQNPIMIEVIEDEQLIAKIIGKKLWGILDIVLHTFPQIYICKTKKYPIERAHKNCLLKFDSNKVNFI